MIKKLNIQEIESIYQKYMVLDFPESELKPCAMIVDAINNNKSIALGYFQNNQLLGYATILISNNRLLLDYFAILKDYRFNGLGSQFLFELYDYLKDYDFILIESETPYDEISNKRIQFYLNSGCKDSLLKGYLYFVDYNLLYKELKKSYPLEEIQKEIFSIYQDIYHDLIDTKYLVFKQ